MPDQQDQKDGCPPISVTSISIEPNCCPLQSPLNVSIKFEVKQIIQNPVWTCQYIVDIAYKRHQIELGTFPVAQAYGVGTHDFEFHLDQVDVTVIKQKHLLNNVGLFVLSLKEASATEAILEVKTVTQVTTSADGTLTRTMFNPLD